MANSLFPRPNHISLHPKTCLCAHRRRKEEDDECEIGNSKKTLGFGSSLPNLLPFLGRSPVRVSGQARGCFHEQGPPVGPPHGLSGGFRLRGQYLISESGGGLSGLMFSRQSQGLHILQEDASFTRAAKMERSEFGIAIPVNVSLSVDLGDEVSSLIQEGPWIFIGLPNLVRPFSPPTSRPAKKTF